jgi:hypothetical protein
MVVRDLFMLFIYDLNSTVIGQNFHMHYETAKLVCKETHIPHTKKPGSNKFFIFEFSFPKLNPEISVLFV